MSRRYNEIFRLREMLETEVVKATEAFSVIKCLANSEPYNAQDYYEDFYSELADVKEI